MASQRYALSVIFSAVIIVMSHALPVHAESRTSASLCNPHAMKVWQVMNDLTPEDEATIDGYLEIACSPAVLHSGRNKELALHLLYQLGGSVKVGAH